MARARRPSGDPLDELLALPETFVVGVLADARFVAGPPGAYIVAHADNAAWRAPPSEPPPSVRVGPSVPPDLARLASDVRTALSEHLTLVPFVQPLLVSTASQSHPSVRATVVPPELLLDVLVEGPPILNESALARIAAIVAEGHLDRI